MTAIPGPAPGEGPVRPVSVSLHALASPPPVTVLTSDPEDILALCGPGVRVRKI